MKRYRFNLTVLCFDVVAKNRWQALRRAVRWYVEVGGELGGEVDSEDPNVSHVCWYPPYRERITMDSIVEWEDLYR